MENNRRFGYRDIPVLGNLIGGTIDFIDKTTGFIPGGITPGDSTIGRGVSDIIGYGRNTLPGGGGIASVPDSQSIQPVLEAEGISLEDAFATPVESGVLSGEGSMGLFDAFGNGGGGFIPPGLDLTEAQMVENGIGDGWTPNNVYEIRTSEIDLNSGMDYGGVSTTRVTDLENGNFAVNVVHSDGKHETFIQSGTTGQDGISNYKVLNEMTGEGQGGSSPRTSGIDIASMIGAAKASQSAQISVSSESRPLQSGIK